MFLLGTWIATNDVACYLPGIPVPSQKSMTHRKMPKAQVVNKIISIKITPKLFDIFLIRLSKAYQSQGGAD